MNVSIKQSFAFLLIFSLLIASVAAQGRQDEGMKIESEQTTEGLRIRGELPDWTEMYSPGDVETAVLAGGCFWGVEAVFEQLEGVLAVDSGYSGGDADTASYKLVGSGATGHAEAVEIVYDPEKISYDTLLDIFFRVAHDPTQLNYQGPDHGSEYRSVLFYKDEDQKRIAESVIQSLESEGVFKDKIVTELSPLEAFYPAEEYHQDFLRLNPSYPYIRYWDIPKIVELQDQYPDLLVQGLVEGKE